MSADAQSNSSGSEDVSDDEHLDVKVNGYHDAENEVDPEADYDHDQDRRLSGKLSESSGSAASDLYEVLRPSLTTSIFTYEMWMAHLNLLFFVLFLFMVDSNLVLATRN